MKKVILATLLFASAVAFSSFKNDTVAVKHAVSDKKKELGTADDKKELGTADDKKELGTADAHKRSTTNDKKELGTAD